MVKKPNVLFVSRELIAADVAYQLKKEGCDVKLFIESESDKDCLDGIIEKTNNWKLELNWVGKDGLIVFDDVGYGKIQDELRSRGYQVFGGSRGGDKLELDRVFCQKIFRKFGIEVSKEFKTRNFTINSAINFIKKNKGTWVLKQNDHDESFTYVSNREDGSDMLSILKNYKDRFGGTISCSLQKRVFGVEIAVGRFFNGKDWVGPPIVNFEHKHLNDGDIGPLGGETGTLMWYDDEKNKLFRETLSKISPYLRKIDHRGYVDINCIVNKNTLYPLEITSRFGSSTNETQSEIQKSSWKEILFSIAKGKNYKIKYKKNQYAITVALTVSPFPYKTSDKKLSQKGVAIFFDEDLIKNSFKHVHFEEVSLSKIGKKNNYYVSGNTGYILYVTGSGKNIIIARKKVYNIIKKIIIPKMFYRTDIGLRFISKDQKLLKSWNWIN